MDRLFGTDGVRGVANVAPMTAEMALEIGRATAYVCKRHEKNYKHRIVIGKDTRLSGYMLENALTAGICSMGVNVFLVGPMPTPGIAFITQNMRADAGIVISASHNPYQDNGLKIFSRAGYKLPDEEEREIEELVTTGHIRDIRPTADDVGKARRIDDAIGRYIVFCKNTFPQPYMLEGLRIVLDCANGATYKIAPIIFSELGADIVTIHADPDGKNINDQCGSQFTDDLVARVRAEKADVGLAFDGDGDRLIAVDERGQVLTGENVLLIAAKMYKEEGRLRNNMVVTTAMSNLGFFKALKKLGVEHALSDVGDRNVLELMKEKDVMLGGESSGHTIFRDRHTTGDGIIAALQILAAMQTGGKTLSELGSLMQRAPQRLVNVAVTRRPPLEEVPELCAAIGSAEKELGDDGRVLVRYSGTQNLCRVMVEATTQEVTTRISDELARIVRENLG